MYTSNNVPVIKIFSYFGFSALVVIVIFLFATTTSYGQLAAASILYFPVALLGLKVFPRKSDRTSTESESKVLSTTSDVAGENDTVQVDVTDVDKRAFLKIIGAFGLSFLFFSFLKRRADSFMPWQDSAVPGTTSLEDTSGNKVNPAERQVTDGYKICEIDDDVVSYYGFTNKDGAWLIMREDTDTSSFRYAKGEVSFPENWSNRKGINYDYFYNVF